MSTSERGEWANGVTIKRTSYGYTWSVAVAATGPTPAELSEAVRVASLTDELLTEMYGEVAADVVLASDGRRRR